VRPYLEQPFTKIGLVEWLKVKALSSSPSTAEQTNKKVKEWRWKERKEGRREGVPRSSKSAPSIAQEMPWKEAACLFSLPAQPG
jgi:hypothetical protein